VREAEQERARSWPKGGTMRGGVERAMGNEWMS